MTKLTLDRILQSQGFGSRKWCRQLIADGEVSIAGETITDYRTAFETDDLPAGWRVIGRARDLGPGERPRVLVDGRSVVHSGWDHFRGS